MYKKIFKKNGLTACLKSVSNYGLGVRLNQSWKLNQLKERKLILNLV